MRVFHPCYCLQHSLLLFTAMYYATMQVSFLCFWIFGLLPVSCYYECKALVTFSPTSFRGIYVLDFVVHTQESTGRVICVFSLHCPFERDLNTGFRMISFEMHQHRGCWVCEWHTGGRAVKRSGWDQRPVCPSSGARPFTHCFAFWPQWELLPLGPLSGNSSHCLH